MGYVFLPVMPPRLLPRCNDSQGACDPDVYPFVDTIGVYGSLLWSWKDVKDTANPYAAFPSVHTLWSCFVAVIWIETAEVRPFWRYLILLYPSITIFCIIITANHFIFDAISAIVLLIFTWALLAGIRHWFGAKSRLGLGPLIAGVSTDILNADGEEYSLDDMEIGLMESHDQSSRV